MWNILKAHINKEERFKITHKFTTLASGLFQNIYFLLCLQIADRPYHTSCFATAFLSHKTVNLLCTNLLWLDEFPTTGYGTLNSNFTMLIQTWGHLWHCLQCDIVMFLFHYSVFGCDQSSGRPDPNDQLMCSLAGATSCHCLQDSYGIPPG